MFCPSCAHNNPDTATFCAACGGGMPRPTGVPHPMMGQPPLGYGPPVAQSRTSGMAVAGFVLSFFCGLLGLIFSIVGYNETKNSGGAVGGAGLAIAGIVISIVSMVIGLFYVVAVNS
jgi:hypothetical protein